MNYRPSLALFVLTVVALVSPTASAYQAPQRPRLPNFDSRTNRMSALATLPADKTAALTELRRRVPDVRVDFDEVLGTPKSIGSAQGFLSGPEGKGRGLSVAATAGFAANDPHRAVKAFLQEHRALFGHGAEVLTAAQVKREFVTPHNGLKTVVWEQQLDGIPVFEGVLVAHTTQRGELVNVSSQFVPDVQKAADQGVPNRAAVQAAPAISAEQAVALAAQNVGEPLKAEAVQRTFAPAGAELAQRFTAAKLKGESVAKLVWLPLSAERLRLCWEVILTSAARGEMFRVLVDAQSGEVRLRRCLTDYLTNATYRVYTSDSPSPFSPGNPTPVTNQPPLVPRQLVTWAALNTNASPNGWINDADNETLGNNVDAHLDRNADDAPDLPRPHGNPWHVFDFTLDLNQSPKTYGDAAVVQLFYWCNWMHDQLYDLGFTEAAGNFQNDNFGRGGLGNDALQADAQDGSGTDNANMSTPPDGTPPRMQMYVFTGPNPDRDGDLDAEIVLHEYTHGLSNRRVGGGVGISALQSGGMGEGWSDFYALSLLSEPGDDVDGVYAAGAYATFMLGGLKENYYYGIRRYPYCTDTNKNPLTFKDIDPDQASAHTGVPRSPIIGNTANEVHNQGEVWCVTLWEARANLVKKYGYAGNQLILQLVTDGMNLSPPNPNFLQARDGIIQADLVDNGGANRTELWAAFAKRGMGFSATSPSSATTSGVQEAYDVPDDLLITPRTGFTASGPVGGPFYPGSQLLVLTNQGTNTIHWTATRGDAWLNVAPASGTLAVAGPAASATVSLDAVAASLPAGIYSNTVWFTNLTSGRSQRHQCQLLVGQPDYFTEVFDADDNDLHNLTFTFTPDGSPSFYSVCRTAAADFPTAIEDDAAFTLANHDVATLSLSGDHAVGLYSQSTNVFFLSSFGDLSFNEPDYSLDESLANHFRLPRITPLLSHLHPSDGGTVYYQELDDRVAITFLEVPEYLTTNLDSFQVEMFYDGRIRLTYLAIGTTSCLVGLSAGNGVPAGFVESDLSAYGVCLPPLIVVVPTSATEGAGVLTNAGQVRLTRPFAADLIVALASSIPDEVTVPASVTIPEGATNASFDITVRDDAELDGTRRVSITATADGFAPGAASLTVFDNDVATLAVSVPVVVSEGDGEVAGTVSVNAAPAVSVLVNLTSSDTTEIQVPPFAIIPAGQTSIVFKVTVVDDHQIDGAQTATITAHVVNWTDGLATITVLDNETTNLMVTLPSMATEGQGVRPNAGAVHISGTLPTNLVVSLESSDLTAIRVPASVTIHAGQTSAVFNLEIVDDGLVDGVQTAMVTARAPGFANGSATIPVYDDETPPVPVNFYPPHLATDIPANVTLSWNGGEGELAVNGGFETGDFNGWRKEISGSTDFVISDENYDPPGPEGLTPPYAGNFCAVSIPLGPSRSVLYQDLTIPAGVTSARLNWAHRIRNYAADFATDQYFRVEIRGTNDEVLEVAFTTQPGDTLLGEWTPQSFDLNNYIGRSIRIAFVVDNQIYYLNVYLDSVSVWLGASGLATTYDVYFGTNSAVGPGELLGSTSNTAWSLPLLAPLTTYYWQIVSKRAGSTVGPVWQFTTRGAQHFELSAVASPQFMGQPFSLSVTAKDELNRVVTNFAGPVTLSALATYPTTTMFSDGFEDGDFSDWVIGYGSYTREVTSQTAAVGSYSFTLIGGNQSPLDGVSHALPNFMPSQVSFYVRASSTTAAGGYFVIGGGSADNIAVFFFMSNDGTMGIYEDQGGWHGIPYDANRWYKVTLALDWNQQLVDYYVDGNLAIPGIPFRGAAVESLAVVDLYNYHNTQAWWDEIEFLQGRPPQSVALSPTNAAHFTNGVWSGEVTVLEPADTMHLITKDGAGHSGTGNDFTTIARNDLSLTVAASTDLAALGQNLTYTLQVTNTGPVAAAGVFVTNTFPDSARFVSATVSLGSFNVAGNTIVFNVGALDGASSAWFTVVVAPTNSGVITNLAVVVRSDADAYLSNNVAAITTAVMPTVRLGDVAVLEGNLGTTTAMFPVTLSGSFPRTVQVSYATADGTATGGSDYLTTGGVLVFSPGEISNAIPVTVNGDVVIEPNETFFVNLSAPVNATFARAQGVATIVNDDGLPGELYTLAWSAIASPQHVNRPFPVTLTARDAAYRIATNFNGRVALTAYDGVIRTNTAGTDTSSGSFPMGTYYHDERTQVIYNASLLGGAGRIASLALDVAGLPGQAMNHWTIRMKHTPLSAYSSSLWEGGGWTVVFQTNLTITSAGWVIFPFSTPFDYNGVDNLMIDFSFNNASWSFDGYCHASYQGDVVTLYYQTDSQYGDPLNWAGAVPYPFTSYWAPNIQLLFGNFLPVQPSVAGNFVSGIWSGNLAVQGLGSNVTLFADDLNGHASASTPFAVTTINDLAITLSASTNQVIAGAPVTFTMGVTNSGPGASTGVLVSNTLSAGVNFVSANTSQGSFSNAGNIVVFNVGPLSSQGKATMSVVVVPQRNGTITNLATVSRVEPEDFLFNNAATAMVAVLPTASINDVALLEGNVGTNHARFKVTLSGPFDQAVAISYATGNGTAIAGSDYLARAGTLSFKPGVTSATVSVSILGDILVEANETFFVNLSAPVNAFLARAQGQGTILNDDGLPGDIYTFAWSPIGSPKFVNRPFAVTLTAKDAAGNVATNFNGKVRLLGGEGVIRANTIGTADTTNSYPMYTGYEDERTQVIYLASELGGAGRLTSLALNVASYPNERLNRWTIRMKHTALSNFPSTVWDASGWTVVCQTNVTVNTLGWVTFPLTTPFDYNGTDNLMVDFSFNNSSSSYNGYCYATSRSSTRTLYYQTDSGYGDPLTWAGSIPSPYSSTNTPDVRFGFGTILPIVPTLTDRFTNGLWNGNITALGISTNFILGANDGNGHTRNSSPFAVLTVDDVSLTVSDSPDPLSPQQNLTYTLIVTNTGPSAATGVRVTNTFPASADFVSASASQGSYNVADNVAVFNLGTLNGASAATLSLVVTPTATGTITNVAQVARSEADNYLPNNMVWTTTRVIPAASIRDVTLKEGNLGVTNAVFAVTLSGAFDQPVQLNYATANGTASAGSDYAATTGTLVFPPRVTSNAIVVAVFGDLVVEPNETFYVNLSSPSNATILRAQGVGTILNDDGLPGDLYTLNWSPIGTTQYVSQPFAVSLTARDISNNLATNFNGSVQLSGFESAPRTNTTGAGVGSTDMPMATAYGQERSQVIYLASELGGAGQITSLALDVATVPDQVMRNWTIRLKHTRLSQYSSYVWETNNWTVVYQANLTVSTTGWATFTLPTPFAYNGVDNVMIDFSFNNTVSGNNGYCRYTSANAVRTLYYETYSSNGYGDPLTWTDSSPYSYGSFSVPNLRVGLRKLIPISPSVVSNFVNGVWTGSLAALELGTNVTILADDLNGHSRASTAFHVLLANDVSLRLSDSPDPLTVGQILTYAMVVTNTGPSVASGVAVADVLPGQLNFVSANTSQGTFSRIGNQVTFSVGDLAGGQSASLSVSVVPIATGTITNTATVSRAEADAYLPNNKATTTTAVLPLATINDVTVSEGNVGTVTALFRVSLSGAFDQLVKINYATADGTATASSGDYVSTSGTLYLYPGTTNSTIAVTINGDILVEANEAFYVNLSSPSNTVIQRAQGMGTILNDDGLPGDILTLQWSPIISPQFLNYPWPATLTARDGAGNVASKFNGSVVLTARDGAARTNTIGTDTSTTYYPMGTYYHDERSQVIYLASELGGAGRIATLALDVDTAPSQVLNNWTIRLKHTALSQYTNSLNYQWEASGWTVVYQGNVSVTAPGWITFVLATPFDYNGVDNLLVDFSYNNSSYGSDGYCHMTYRSSGSRALVYPTDSDFGDPLTWSGTTPNPYVEYYTPNLRLVFENRVPLLPTVAGPFVSGVWTGQVTMLGFGTNVTVVADDLNGHTRASGPFVVAAGYDVGISLAATPSSVGLGSNLTYTMLISNTGPTTATGVWVTNLLPAAVNFLSASTTQGSFSVGGSRVIFSLGSLPARASATCVIQVTPLAWGTLTDQAFVVWEGADSNPANNSAVVTTAVLPIVSITDTAVREGNVGTTNAVFWVVLSAPSASPVSVNYATADGSAVAGSDYISQTNTLVIPPGALSNAIPIAVKGDLLVEPDEIYYVDLTAATNAMLGKARGVGTILNEDGAPGQLYAFTWSTIPTPQFATYPFAAILTALDYSSNPVTNFAGPVTLGIRTASASVFTIGTGTLPAPFPVGTAAQDERTQVIYLASDMQGPCRITAVALPVTTVPGQTLQNWTIRMKHTALSSYSVPLWEDTGWTVVYRNNETIKYTGYFNFAFPVAFDFDGTNNLMVDFSFHNASSSSNGLCRYTATTLPRTLYYYANGTEGDPLTWSSNTPLPKAVITYPNLRFSTQPTVPMAPTAVSDFLNGVAVISLTAFQPATNAFLLADDKNGHTAQGNNFDLYPNVDTNANGLPDAWELLYFGSLNAPDGGPNDDADRDGLTNLQEFRAGTNPTNAADALRITSVRVSGFEVNISFTAVAAKSYQVERGATVPTDDWIVVSRLTAGTNSVLQVTDPTDAGSHSRFYRVRLVP